MSFKGACVSKWSQFIEKGAWKRLKDEWVTIDSAEEHKKGRVNYSTPNFKFNTSLTDKEYDMVSDKASELVEYMDNYFNKTELVEIKEDLEPASLEDLDF